MAEPAPVIVTAQMGKADQAYFDELRTRYFPPERNFVRAHITLFHHLPPTHLPEIKARLADLAREHAPPAAILSGLMLLGRGVAFRVDCPALLQMREELASDLTGLFTPQDQARPRFHITVQNKVEPATAKALFAHLSAGFEPRSLSITGLAAWYYRGGPWEAIQSWKFSGRR